jgi:hypothetical protein
VKPIFLLLALLLPLGLAIAGAAGAPVIGTWDCAALDERGAQSYWTLVVKADGDKLSATIQSKQGGEPLPLVEPKVDGSRFSFKVQVNQTEIVAVELKIDGNRMDGKFTGSESPSGSIVATRVVPPASPNR